MQGGPRAWGLRDALVVRLDYSTYLGGSEADYGTDVFAEDNGLVTVVGYTWSPNFPTTLDAYKGSGYLSGDNVGFVTKTDPTGSSDWGNCPGFITNYGQGTGGMSLILEAKDGQTGVPTLPTVGTSLDVSTGGMSPAPNTLGYLVWSIYVTANVDLGACGTWLLAGSFGWTPFLVGSSAGNPPILSFDIPWAVDLVCTEVFWQVFLADTGPCGYLLSDGVHLSVGYGW